MNLLKRSAVAQYPSDSTERIIVEDICLNERRPHFSANADRSWSAFVKVLKRVNNKKKVERRSPIVSTMDVLTTVARITFNFSSRRRNHVMKWLWTVITVVDRTIAQ